MVFRFSPILKSTKTLRVSRGISLLFLWPQHSRWDGASAPQPGRLYLLERPGTHCTGSWVDPAPVWTGGVSCPHTIPDGVISIFHRNNPPGRTVALVTSQPLTEISTRDISWGEKWPMRRADNLTTYMCWPSLNLEASTFWKPQALSRSVMWLL